MQYTIKARALAKTFEHVEFRQIPREENVKADLFAKLGSNSVESTLEQPVIDIDTPSIWNTFFHVIEEKKSWMTLPQN